MNNISNCNNSIDRDNACYWLYVCSIDLMKDLETRPVARQLRYSLLKYMQSNAFAPKTELDAELLKKLLLVKLPMMF